MPIAETIGQSAFEGCTKITSINLPKAKTIESKAFTNCAELSNIEMPIAETIGESAFEGCTKITEINLNNIKDITNIGLLFKGNTALKSVKMNNIVDIPEGLFDGCTSLATVNIDKCQTIGKAAFKSTALTGDLNFGEVTSVGESAFEGCTNITSINLPKAKTIEAKAFINCSKINKAELAVVEAIKDSTFENCTSLGSIEISGKITGKNVFKGCTALNNVKMNNIIDIPKGLFDGCTSLTTVNIDKCQTIGKAAFKNTALTGDLNYGEVTSVGESAFEGCTNITSINLPKAKTLEAKAFINCTKMNKAELAVVEEIKDSAFENCKALATVNIDKCQTIGKAALRNTGISGDIQYGEVTGVGESAFESCAKITSINLPKAKTLEAKAFINCTSLRKATLPQIDTISNWCFASCKMDNIDPEQDFPNVTIYGDYAFSSISATTFKANSKLERIGRHCFSKASCTKIDLSISHVTVIGAYAFSDSNYTKGDDDYCENTSKNTILTEFIIPKSTAIVEYQTGCFCGLMKLKPFDITGAKKIGAHAFWQGPQFDTDLVLPNLTDLGQGAFGRQDKMLSLNIQSIKNLGEILDQNTISKVDYKDEGIFAYNKKDMKLILGELEQIGVGILHPSDDSKFNCDIYIGNYTIDNLPDDRKNIFEAPNLKVIQGRAFTNNKKITKIICKNCVEVGCIAFNNMDALTEIELPSVNKIKQDPINVTIGLFYGSNNLTNIDLRSLENLTCTNIKSDGTTEEIPIPYALLDCNFTKPVNINLSSLKKIDNLGNGYSRLFGAPPYNNIKNVNGYSNNNLYGSNDKWDDSKFGIKNISSLDLTSCTYFGEGALRGCIGLDIKNNGLKISPSNITYVGVRAFSDVGANSYYDLISAKDAKGNYTNKPSEVCTETWTFGTSQNPCVFAVKKKNPDHSNAAHENFDDNYGYQFAYCCYPKIVDLTNVVFRDIGNLNSKENIDYLPPGIFCGNIGIQKVILPKNITKIASFAFFNCNNYMVYKNDFAKYNAYTGPSILQCRPQLTEVDLSNITEIGGGAFNWCVNLNNITSLSKVETIWDGKEKLSDRNYSFSCCYNLPDLDLTSLKNVGSRPFVLLGNDPDTSAGSKTNQTITWNSDNKASGYYSNEWNYIVAAGDHSGGITFNDIATKKSTAFSDINTSENMNNTFENLDNKNYEILGSYIGEKNNGKTCENLESRIDEEIYENNQSFVGNANNSNENTSNNASEELIRSNIYNDTYGEDYENNQDFVGSNQSCENLNNNICEDKTK